MNSTVDAGSYDWRNKQFVAGSLGDRSQIVSDQSISLADIQASHAAYLLYVIIMNAVRGTSST